MCGRCARGINCFDANVQVHSGFGVCRDTYIRLVWFGENQRNEQLVTYVLCSLII